MKITLFMCLAFAGFVDALIWDRFACTFTQIGIDIYVECDLKVSTPLQQLNSSTIESLTILSTPENAFTLPDNILNKCQVGMLHANSLGLRDLKPATFYGIVSLQNLYLSNNSISSIDWHEFPSNFTKNLHILNLEQNQLEQIPYFDPSEFVSLKYLDLNSNKIKNIDGFLELGGLDEVVLNSNRIESVNFSLFSTSLRGNLTSLKLNANKIREISPLGHFPRLEFLSLYKNQLSNLDSSTFSDLPNLKCLYLSRNRLVYLPRGLFKGLFKLESLHLAGNQLSDLRPDDLEDLVSLTSLELNRNNLASVSLEWFAQSRLLETLDLSYNRIRVFNTAPNLILPKLSFLKLSGNFLKAIDEPRSLFPQLSSLYLDNNELSKFPTDLSGISVLDLSNQKPGTSITVPDYNFWRSRSSTTYFQINLSLNANLTFSSRSLCFLSNEGVSSQTMRNHYLDLTISPSTLEKIPNCTLKMLGMYFHQVRIFLVEDKKSTERTTDNDDNINQPICNCHYRLFLSEFDILIRDFCPRFKSYCADKIDLVHPDCQLNDCPNFSKNY